MGRRSSGGDGHRHCGELRFGKLGGNGSTEIPDLTATELAVKKTSESQCLLGVGRLGRWGLPVKKTSQ